MTYKELMFESLTELLEEGEILQYPIYGTLDQQGLQEYAYFGFAGDDLLIATLAGKSIAYTTRVPLDIKSIDIKQTAIFRQYKINISFREGAPCKIVAAPRVAVIDTQKENLPMFLEYLSSRSPKQSSSKASDIDGKKIRWQYFNLFIYAMVFMMLIVLTIVSVLEAMDGNLDLGKFFGILFDIAIGVGAFLSPFILLSVLNKFLFGSVVSVFTDKGIYFDNEFISWSDIDSITYHPRIGSKYRFEPSYATLSVRCKDNFAYTVDIVHFPRYALRTVKKYDKRISVKYDLNQVGFVVILTLIVSVFAIFIVR